MEEVQLQEHLAQSVLQDQVVMVLQHKLNVLPETTQVLAQIPALLVEMTQATLLLELRLA